MRTVTMIAAGAVCAAASLAARAQDKPAPKPSSATISLRLAAGDALELTEKETVTAVGVAPFTSVAQWYCSAEVKSVKDDGSVSLTLRCDRFTMDFKTELKGDMEKFNNHIQIDTDVKPNPYVVGDGRKIVGFEQLAAVGGRTMTVVLARDGRVLEAHDEFRPRRAPDDRSEAQKSADARSEVLRFFLPLPSGPIRANTSYKFERWFTGTSYVTPYRASGPVTETVKVTSLAPGEVKCELTAASPKKPAKDTKKRETAPGVYLSEYSIKGTATLDLATGLCTSRAEVFGAFVDEVFSGVSAQPIGYSVTTEATCRRKSK